MRPGRWLAGLGLLLLAGVGLVAALPALIGAQRFHPEIVELASAALGRRVTIEGRVGLDLFPEPVLTAERVSLAAEGADVAGMTAAALRLRVAPMALLAGRIEARELVVRGMELRLPWPLPPDALALRTPDWLTELSARVEGGRIVIGAMEIGGVEASIGTRAGLAWNATGRAVLAGQPVRFALTLTRPGGDNAVGVTLGLDGQSGSMELSGQMAAGGDFAGRLALRAADAAALIPAPPGALRAEGRLIIADGRAAMQAFEGDHAGASLRGAASLRLSPSPRLDLAVTLGRLDLDAWRVVLARPRAAPPLSMGLDLTAESARAMGGTLRGLRAAFEFGAAGIEITELSATLPGEAELRAAGRLTSGVGHFDGHVALIAPAVRTTLAWLAPDVTLPAGAPASARLAGRLSMEAGVAAVDELTGSLDAGGVEGSLGWRGGARPAVRAALRLGRVEADPWLAALGDPATLIARLGGVDADLRLEAGQVAIAGQVLDGVVLDLASSVGRVTLRRVEAGLAGGRIAGAATLLEGGQVTDARLSAGAPAGWLDRSGVLAWLPPALGARIPPWVREKAELSLEAQAGSADGNLTLRGTGGVGDLAFETSLALAGNGGWTGRVALRHPGAIRLLGEWGLNDGGWIGEGSLGLVASLAGGAGKGRVEHFDLSAGTMRASGALAIGDDITGRVGFETLPLPPAAALAGGLVALPPGQPLRLTLAAARLLREGHEIATDARATLATDEAGWRLTGIAARVAEGGVSGMIGADLRGTAPRLRAEMTLSGLRLDLDWPEAGVGVAGSRLDGTVALTAGGGSAETLRATLAGEARLDLSGGALRGLALGGLGRDFADAALEGALAGGETALDRARLAFTATAGVVTLTGLEAGGPAGRLSGRGTIDLPGDALRLDFDLVPGFEGAPRIGLRLDGRAEAPRRSIDLSDVVRWRAAAP